MKKVLLLLMGLIALGCSKEENTQNKNTSTLNIQNKEIYLHREEKKNVNVTSTSGNKITYSISKDRLYASVDEKGDVIGIFVGDDELTVTDGVNIEKVKVHVIPRYDFFYKPYMNFGASREEVKNYMKEGAFKETDDGMYEYSFGDLRDLKKFYRIYYSFENDKLKNIIITFPFESNYTDDMPNYLKERYVPVSSEGNRFVFGNPDKNNSFIVGFTFNVFKNTCNLIYAK